MITVIMKTKEQIIACEFKIYDLRFFFFFFAVIIYHCTRPGIDNQFILWIPNLQDYFIHITLLP